MLFRSYRNGALLGSADYTATNGTTVVLASAATSGDLVTVESFLVSSVLNAIPNTAYGVSRTNLPAGSVLQVVSTTKTDNFSTTSSTLVDITGLSVTITPTSATSKILISVALQVGGENNYYAEFSLLRGSTAIGNYTGGSGGTVGFMGANSVNDYAQYYIETAANQYLDSPATTSATTYKMQAQSLNVSAPTIYINRTYDVANSTRCTGSSTITAMEISA